MRQSANKLKIDYTSILLLFDSHRALLHEGESSYDRFFMEKKDLPNDIECYNAKFLFHFYSKEEWNTNKIEMLLRIKIESCEMFTHVKYFTELDYKLLCHCCTWFDATGNGNGE